MVEIGESAEPQHAVVGDSWAADDGALKYWRNLDRQIGDRTAEAVTSN